MIRNHLNLILLLAACCAVLAAPGCEDSNSSGPAGKTAQSKYDESYISALAVADMFCEAWRNRDATQARRLMTKRMNRDISDERLRDAIVGYANPSHASYEVFGGKKLAEGSYQFKVRLFFQYRGGHGDRLEHALDKIVIARESSGVLRVDGFPIPQAAGQIQPGKPLVPQQNQ